MTVWVKEMRFAVCGHFVAAMKLTAVGKTGRNFLLVGGSHFDAV